MPTSRSPLMRRTECRATHPDRRPVVRRRDRCARRRTARRSSRATTLRACSIASATSAPGAAASRACTTRTRASCRTWSCRSMACARCTSARRCKEGNNLLVVELMNPDLVRDGQRSSLPKGELHVFRAKLLWDGACYEHIRLQPPRLEPVAVEIGLQLRRRLRRPVRGARHACAQRRGELAAAADARRRAACSRYRGLDGRQRAHPRPPVDPAPTGLDRPRARFELRAAAGRASATCTARWSATRSRRQRASRRARLRRGVPRATASARAAQRRAECTSRELESADEPLAGPLGVRPRDADHRPADGPVPVCRRALVLAPRSAATD